MPEVISQMCRSCTSVTCGRAAMAAPTAPGSRPCGGGLEEDPPGVPDQPGARVHHQRPPPPAWRSRRPGRTRSAG